MVVKTVSYTPVNPTLTHAMPPLSLGTTIIVMKYAGGVLLSADTRATMGNLVVDRFTPKILPITDKIYTCIAGSVSHAQFLVNEVRAHLMTQQMDLHANLNGMDPTVATAANILSIYLHKYREFLHAAFILGGVDNTGFHCINAMIGGSVLEEDYAISGSGGVFIKGLMKELYKPELTRAEAIDLARKLLKTAISLDTKSGGFMRFVAIEQGGLAEEGTRML
ncbi:Proteasome subunit beta type 9 precursor [Giardia duodenalis assemblage B]|uniref:proteasome endopeptidase complex n=1 Tax=Giardia duodenalis assemblage B TaxID=1394984 RepID=A0A132NZT8_GIAIN|nr:Proteasome subunit beta type 9 precursor [Giardia intestinalis assemblage B]